MFSVAGGASGWRSAFGSNAVACAPAGEPENDPPAPEQHVSPVEVHIDSERLLVERGITHRSVNQQDSSQQQKQTAQRQANVNSHRLSYQKIIFSKTVPAITMIASDAGLAYHAIGSSSGFGVSE